MKRFTATLLVFTALSAPALAESPTVRNLHSWDYVQQVANPAAPAEAPAADHHESHSYYHHESGKKGHAGKHHHGKKHHGEKKAAHHHHHKDASKEKPKEQPKQ